jgi:hypothetical protein
MTSLTELRPNFKPTKPKPKLRGKSDGKILTFAYFTANPADKDGDSVIMHQLVVWTRTGKKTWDGVPVEALPAEQRALYEATVPLAAR